MHTQLGLSSYLSAEQPFHKESGGNYSWTAISYHSNKRFQSESHWQEPLSGAGIIATSSGSRDPTSPTPDLTENRIPINQVFSYSL